ncbi:MBL fold metallo-hydrolase [Chlorobium ferrooxidans]|uniref:Beta-lactamase-like n=1 Tax=Chlorobium ferrooxidans DSM 13031 TaxID=377431 RepID=Q0YT00_9CHLB|nr:MBL fold metallo-hydrolase [Chlorobium ferrooxidans]EAT59464.1 Beta-lactamase-like [Chlorobium ferrooxidans DSM 13031]
MRSDLNSILAPDSSSAQFIYIQMMQIGDYHLYSLDVQDFALDGGAMFGVVPKVMWEKFAPADHLNRINLKARVLLIAGKGRHILVDTGMGTAWPDKLRSIYALSDCRLQAELKAVGLEITSITDVIYTHLHFDHVGGAFRQGADKLEPLFPDARHYVQRENYLSALKPNPKERVSYSSAFIEAFGRLSGLELLDGPRVLFPGIELFSSNGHTKGQQLVRVSGAEGSLVHTADLIPSSAHLPSSWVMGYDIEPLTVIEEKTALLHHASEEREMLFFGHDPSHQAATLRRDDKGAVVVDKFIDL